MRKKETPGRWTLGRLGTVPIVCGLLVVAPLLAGCSRQSLAQAGTATASPPAPAASVQATATATAPALNTPAAGVITATTVSTPTQLSLLITPAAAATSTGTLTVGSPTAEGTPTARPTPTGTAPDPVSALNALRFVRGFDTLVKRDLVQLDGGGPEESIFTIAGPGEVLTAEVRSTIGVLTYDQVYREWSVAWQSTPVSGTASPLPAVTLGPGLGYNGGDLLRTGAPVFVLRTTTQDGRAHLYLYSWDRDKRTAQPVKMLAPGGSTGDAAFDADLDVNVADLDDDGVYEVVADNVAGVQVWRWDPANLRYAPEGTR
ncbi:MAG: hypothetical protein M3328_18430 [Chloroflexota bacterium]|nr:hypothetical protein [Chloroflexota bacterium]